MQALLIFLTITFDPMTFFPNLSLIMQCRKYIELKSIIGYIIPWNTPIQFNPGSVKVGQTKKKCHVFIMQMT